MTNMNEVIAGNISRCLNHLGKKQNELAEAVHLPKQTISKMLNGSRMISAPELKAIADFCKTTMDKLVQIPEQQPCHHFYGQSFHRRCKTEPQNGRQTHGHLPVQQEISDKRIQRKLQ